MIAACSPMCSCSTSSSAGRSYTFTFAEVLLVLGMFLAPPGHLIMGRLVGELCVLTLKERQPLRKVALNLAMFYAECVVLVVVHQALGGGLVDRPATGLGLCLRSGDRLAEMVGFFTVATGDPLARRPVRPAADRLRRSVDRSGQHQPRADRAGSCWRTARGRRSSSPGSPCSCSSPIGRTRR